MSCYKEKNLQILEILDTRNCNNEWVLNAKANQQYYVSVNFDDEETRFVLFGDYLVYFLGVGIPRRTMDLTKVFK